MERSELKELLPFGAQKEIAELAGVKQSNVNHFLNGKNNSYKIEIAAMKVAARILKEKKEALAELQSQIG